MEVAVNRNIPQGFDMDDGGAAPIYRPNEIPPEPEEVEEEPEEEPVQPIYYEIPMPKQQEQRPEIIYQQAPQQPQTETIFNSISPLIWMVIVFIGFILGFFMGMGSGGKSGSQAAPIILTTSGRGMSSV